MTNDPIKALKYLYISFARNIRLNYPNPTRRPMKNQILAATPPRMPSVYSDSPVRWPLDTVLTMNMDRAPNTPHRWYRSRVLAWSDTDASKAQHYSGDT